MKKKEPQAAQSSRKKRLISKEALHDDGYDNQYATVYNAVRDIERKVREAFIRQQYVWGDSLEFDLR